MICVSLGNISFYECRRILGQVEMAEIRLDLLNFSPSQIRTIFSSHPRLIATFRSGNWSEEKRKFFLQEAIAAGARYVDLDIQTDRKLIGEIKKSINQKNCELIISYHNFTETPEKSKLHQIINQAFALGADIVKVACFCREPTDNARLIGLLNQNQRVIICGLGPAGTITRVASVLCGCPFTYAYWAGTNPTAPDQLSYQQLKKIYELLSMNPEEREVPALRQERKH